VTFLISRKFDIENKGFAAPKCEKLKKVTTSQDDARAVAIGLRWSSEISVRD